MQVPAVEPRDAKASRGDAGTNFEDMGAPRPRIAWGGVQAAAQGEARAAPRPIQMAKIVEGDRGSRPRGEPGRRVGPQVAQNAVADAVLTDGAQMPRDLIGQ